eukprot:272794-Rhodomonas_salina.2
MQGGSGGVGLEAAGAAAAAAANPPPVHVPVPHPPQGVPRFCIAMMALTGEVELGVEEAVASPFAFHSNLTEGLGVNEDSIDVHYLVVDS